jgi:hypothetical protein
MAPGMSTPFLQRFITFVLNENENEIRLKNFHLQEAYSGQYHCYKICETKDSRKLIKSDVNAYVVVSFNN